MSTHTFGYNGLDTRTSKTVGSATTSYLRNGAYVTDGVLSETATSGTTKFTPGISERRGSTTQYLHSGLKNADARTSGQSVDATRQYDAFGNLEGSSGTWNGPFGYAGGFGYLEDSEAGLKLLGHRYYDPTTGRFLSKDPIGDGRNWYSYCENNPIPNGDADGLQLFRILPRLSTPRGSSVFGKPPFVVFRGVRFYEQGLKTWSKFQEHLGYLKDHSSNIAQLTRKLAKSKSPKERERLAQELAKERKEKAGHEKEMDQKWPNWRKSKWDDGQMPPNYILG